MAATHTTTDCIHDSRLVRKRNAAGHWMFTYQCATCGDIDRGRIPSGGLWVPKSAVADDLELIPVFDDTLRERVEAAERAAKPDREQHSIDPHLAGRCGAYGGEGHRRQHQCVQARRRRQSGDLGVADVQR